MLLLSTGEGGRDGGREGLSKVGQIHLSSDMLVWVEIMFVFIYSFRKT